MQQQTQERVADSLTTLAIGSWSVSLADINLMLETATFVLGFVAGAFSVFFHVRRYLRERKLNEKSKDE